MQDGKTATTSDITVTIVANTEGPKFSESLKTIYVRVEDSISYSLPSMADADGDVITLTNTNMPRFGKYSGTTFAFSPTRQD